VVVQSRGCGSALGAALIAAGALVLLVHYDVLPQRLLDWWPVIIIAWGVWMLVAHYWRVLVQRREMAIPGIGPVVRVRPRRSAPVFPVLVIAVGTYLLLSNLHYISFGIIVAAVLILLGISLLVRQRAPMGKV
jgi:hypothetical protein